MSEVTVDQALQLALEHQQNNDYPQAEEIYRQILLTYPDQSDALYLLGMLCHTQSRDAEAQHLVLRAIHLAPNQPSYRVGLGLILQSLRRIPEAVQEYRDALQLNPEDIEARAHLGVALGLLGRYDQAITEFQQVLTRAPSDDGVLANLGLALTHVSRFDDAITALRSAIATNSKNADYHASLSTALLFTGDFDAAAVAARQTLLLAPDHGPARLNLSKALFALNLPEEGFESAQRAALLLPDSIDAQVNLAESFHAVGKLEEAATIYRNALKANPNSAELLNNLAGILKDQGFLDQAIQFLRQTLTLQPNSHVIRSNLLYALQYDPNISPENLFKEHKEYDRIHARPLTSRYNHTNDRSPNRRLRVGYISSEFRNHALGYYLLPLLENHDKSNFETFCYSSVLREDSSTARFKTVADHWLDARNLSDNELADKVRLDQIDILIDCHQHMAGNRLLVYARKPAPVQIAFAGYPGTTGLTTMDYRLTDQYLEPSNLPAVPSSETPLRLPDSFWCYLPQHSGAPINPLPAQSNKFITFGNLNNFCKVNPQILALWATILRPLPASRLLLLAAEGSHRDRTKKFLQERGISPDRIQFLPRAKPEEYFHDYHQIDISLDSFPYTGHTTSLDSFYMGVPVVSLLGKTPVSRSGLTFLANLNLTDLAAETPEDFTRIALALANALPRLANLRSTLRDRLQKSPLMDGPRYAKAIETLYRQAWQNWCSTP